jgi:hypothetical protein
LIFLVLLSAIAEKEYSLQYRNHVSQELKTGCRKAYNAMAQKNAARGMSASAENIGVGEQ